ncbi:hypothetical protein QF000_000255 [Paraburkholderia atlantica]|uniref:hypothetical protein n=1 Tax=Paraburkholderia atlantica TaxID=2654982 RepID=UPI003D22D80D
MLKSSFICAEAALALVSLAACSSKATPNEENFTAAVNQRMALHPMKCLPPVSWPMTADPSDAGNVMGFYDNAVALAKAGLISRRDIANYSTNNQKRAVFSLTDEGRKQLVHDNSQPPPAPGEESGRFCYHVKLVKVVKWDEPVSITGAPTETGVTYSYEMTDVPQWAHVAELRTTYPEMGSDLAGHGEGRLLVRLVNGEWRPRW